MKISSLQLRLIAVLVTLFGLTGIASQKTAAQTTATFVYVSNTGDGTVSVINTSNNSVVATIPLCNDCGPGPEGLAVTPGGGFVYVANEGNGTVSVIATATNTVAAIIQLPTNLCPSCVSTPVGVAITPDGTRAYVSDTGENAIDVIDIATNTVSASITADVSGPKAIAMSPNGVAAYYVFGTNSVGRIDTDPVPGSETYNTHTTTLMVGNTPTGIAVNPDSTFIYVTNQADNTVSVIPNSFPNFGGPAYPPFPTIALPAGSGPYAVAFTPNGAQAYVVNQTNSTVSVINTATSTVSKTLSAPTCIDPLNQVAVSSDGSQVYVADSDCGTADVILTATNTFTATPVSVGFNPFGVAASSSQSMTLGPPGTTTTFFFNTDTLKITPITNLGGELVTVDAFLIKAAAFPSLPGFPGETCIPYGDDSSGGVDTCVEFQVHCIVPGISPTVCNFVYLIATGYDLPADLSSGIGGPGFLVAHGVDCPLTGTSTAQSIFLSYDALVKDPTTHGGSRGPSCFVATYTPGATPITNGTFSKFTGWTTPVVDSALNQVKAGSTAPLKFTISDNLGNPITNLSFCNSFTVSGGANVCSDNPSVSTPWVNIASYAIACPNSAPVNSGTDLSLVASGGSGLQNLGSGSYQLNWKTAKSLKGTCANVVVTFDSTLTVVPATLGFQFN